MGGNIEMNKEVEEGMSMEDIKMTMTKIDPYFMLLWYVIITIV